MMDAEKDVLIATWSTIVGTTKLTVNEHEEVTDVQRQGGLLEVSTAKGKYMKKVNIAATMSPGLLLDETAFAK